MAVISEGGFEQLVPWFSRRVAATAAPPERSGANRRRLNELGVRFLVKSKKGGGQRSYNGRMTAISVKAFFGMMCSFHLHALHIIRLGIAAHGSDCKECSRLRVGGHGTIQ